MILSACNINFRYSRESDFILQDFSLVAHPGDIIAVVGENGCGKTTLLNLLCGIIPKMIPGSMSGIIKINSTSLTDMSLPEISRYVSLLMPDPDLQLFFPIVEHELAFGPENLKLPREEIRARIENTLLLLDISRLRDHETSTLSFGQKKIVTLAALLTLSPQVYLLDEPGAGLSSDNIKKVKEIILNLARESRIVFIADHNSEILEISNRTINLGKKNHVCN